MKYTKIALTLALMVMFAATSFAQNEFVGVKTCGMCHKAKTGDQLKIWENSAHAKAFEVLKSDEAKKIAEKKGLGDPSTEAACLKCHVTAYNADASLLGKKYDKEDGVGCESCHGAGSEYKSNKTMKDHAAAVAAGMTDFSAEGSAETHCKTCHNEESPTFKGFVFAEKWEKIKHPTKK